MIKLVYCLKRLPNLTLAEFQDYWLHKHAPLVRKHSDTLRIQRYIQVHTNDHPVNADFQDSRGGPEGFDGVAELWWTSVEDLVEGMSTPEGQEAGAALLEDEKIFIHLPSSPLWIANEHVIIG